MDNSPRQLTYALVAGQSAAKNLPLTGLLSVDGKDVSIEGLSSLAAGCALTWERDASAAGWKLRLNGQPTSEYVIEESADGVSWAPWRQARTALDGKAEIPLSEGISLRFYRAKSL